MNDVSPENPFYSVENVAKMFDVNPYTVRRWIREGKLTAVKINNKWRIQRSELTRLANEEHGA